MPRNPRYSRRDMFGVSWLEIHYHYNSFALSFFEKVSFLKTGAIKHPFAKIRRHCKAPFRTRHNVYLATRWDNAKIIGMSLKIWRDLKANRQGVLCSCLYAVYLSGGRPNTFLSPRLSITSVVAYSCGHSIEEYRVATLHPDRYNSNHS